MNLVIILFSVLLHQVCCENENSTENLGNYLFMKYYLVRIWISLVRVWLTNQNLIIWIEVLLFM